MKLWKKVYLFTLVILTLGVNLGVSGIVYFTYEQMLQSEKERCQAEYVIMQQNVSANIAEMEQSILLNTEYFGRFITAYSSYFEADTMLIGIVGEQIVVGEASGATDQEFSTEDKIAASQDFVLEDLPKEDGIFVEKEDKTTIYIAQVLDEDHENYRIVMRRTLDSFDETWATLQPLYLIGGIILSLGVSLALALAVRLLLKPLDQLEAAAKEVQQENWSARVHIKGDNELAQLGKQFNAMAGSVEENILKLEQQSQQKQELIDNLAHEMNTPITSIGGFADYMRISQLSKEEQEECLDFIIRENHRLKEISSTLLSMAQMEQEEGFFTVFSLKQLCSRIEELYTKQFHEKNIAFDMECKVLEMYGNEVLIESLLRNLITNAGRALSDREQGRIDVAIYKEDESLKMRVSDNGCGIEKEHLEQIFEPFYRVDKARSRENGGSGLGLPFCKKIVESHNGTISVESEPGQGTTFMISFTIS
ncbi:MAG: HAMP domain-containing histidine kinase [Agathobacter sp.]|nr:HAMP domain-containing histidine kinase [Agathobacter sp.]